MKKEGRWHFCRKVGHIKDLSQEGCSSCEALKLRREGALPVTPIPISHSGRPPEDPLPLPLPEFPEPPEAWHSLPLSFPRALESSEDTDPPGFHIDLTTLTLNPRSSLLIIDAELNGVPVSALIDSGAQGCFISSELAVRLEPSKTALNHSLEACSRLLGIQ